MSFNNVWFFFLALLIQVNCSFKILLFTPGLSRSHVIFSHRLSETLTSLGHNVTIWSVRLTDNIDMPPPNGIEEHRFRMPVNDDVMAVFQKQVFASATLMQQLAMFASFSDLWVEACRVQLEDNYKLINLLRNTQYDLALMHSFDICPLIIADRLGIKRQAYTMVGTYITDNVNTAMGIPMTSSFIPTPFMSTAGDTMTVTERAQNLALSWVGNVITRHLGVTAGLNRLFSLPPNDRQSDPTDLLAGRVRTVFVNGEAMLDFPRPLPHSVHYLGSVLAPDVQKGQSSKLDETWLRLMDDRSKAGVILMSFGTIIQAQYVPDYVQDNIVRNLANFTSYNIIWKFDGSVASAQPFEHIHIVKWMPQKELLFHARTRAFVTHGGYNSLLEGAQAGVPMVFLPLFNDQYPNAFRGQRLHMGVTVRKESLRENTTRPLSDALEEVLSDGRYEASAKRMVECYGSRIVPATHQLQYALRKTMDDTFEKYAKSGPAQRLNLLQLHCIDVIAVWTFIFLISIYAFYTSIMYAYHLAKIAKNK